MYSSSWHWCHQVKVTPVNLPCGRKQTQLFLPGSTMLTQSSPPPLSQFTFWSAVFPEDSFAFNSGIVFRLLSVILTCRQHSKHSFQQQSLWSLRQLDKSQIMIQTTLFSEEQIPFQGTQPTFRRSFMARELEAQPWYCRRRFRWVRGWLSNFLLQDGLSTKQQSVLSGNPHSRCSQSLWSFRIHSFIYALADDLHKQRCRKDSSLESFTLFDASFVVILFYCIYTFKLLYCTRVCQVTEVWLQFLADLGTWAVRTDGNKVWNSVWLRSHFREAVWGGDLRMSDFGVQCFQEKCGESSKQQRKEWSRMWSPWEPGFLRSQRKPWTTLTTAWHRRQALNVFCQSLAASCWRKRGQLWAITANALFLVRWGASVLLSMVTTLIYTPSNGARGYPVLRIPANACCLWPFW